MAVVFDLRLEGGPCLPRHDPLCLTTMRIISHFLRFALSIRTILPSPARHTHLWGIGQHGHSSTSVYHYNRNPLRGKTTIGTLTFKHHQKSSDLCSTNYPFNHTLIMERVCLYQVDLFMSVSAMWFFCFKEKLNENS